MLKKQQFTYLNRAGLRFSKKLVLVWEVFKWVFTFRKDFNLFWKSKEN